MFSSCKFPGEDSVLQYNPVAVYSVIKHQVIIQQIGYRSSYFFEYSYPEMFRWLPFHSSTESNASLSGKYESISFQVT